jgi:hypothetical protein
VAIGRIAHAGDHGTPFRQRGLHVEPVVIAVQIVSALRNNFTLEVLPGAGADPIARIDGGFAVGGLGTQIGSPGFAASTCPLRQLLAVPVSTFDTAKIGALAGVPRP